MIEIDDLIVGRGGRYTARAFPSKIFDVVIVH
jgi:hypothetical protein